MTEDDITRLKGWDFFDKDKQAALKGRAALKAHELDTLAWRVFSTEDGKRLMRWMVSQTVLRPTVTAESTQFQAGIREGQNDIVRQLLGMIERSKKGVRA